MKINITCKITLTFVFLIALTLSGVYIYLNSSLKDHTYQRIKNNLVKNTRLVKSYLEREISRKNNRQSMDILADELGKDLGLRVSIIDLDGKVTGDSELDYKHLKTVENHLHRPEIQQALSNGTGESIRYSTTVRKDMLYIASVVGKNKRLALIRLAIPLSEIHLLSNHLKRLLVVSFALAFLLSIVIAYIASVRISKPVKEISYIANSIAEGDFSGKINVTANDEIGELAQAFNNMAEQIKLKIKEVTDNKTRLETVLLSMFEGVMAVDKEGIILLMNKRFKDFFKIKENTVGKKPLEVIRNSAIQDMVDRNLNLEHSVDSREIVVLFPEEKTLLVNASPVMREGLSEGAVLVFHDITALRHLEKVRSDFVANVSHELRTPITSIKGYAETLLDGALEDKKNAYDFLKIIFSDSERVSLLIDDLLDLTRIESGNLQFTFRPCSLKLIAEKIVSSLKKQSLDRNVTIKVDIPEDLPQISGDEARLEQVLQNLIDNAVKYNRKKGMVTVAARAKNNAVYVDISDTGVGIAAEEIPRLFERFYRIDKARSGSIGGTGLGLSIVKHIVHAHKGQVLVTSIPGRGSTFSFVLPAAGC